MPLSASLGFTFAATLTKAFDLAAGTVPYAIARTLSWADGAGAGQANRIYQDRNTLAASGTIDVDLSGTLTDVYGDPVVFARIKALIMTAADANTNNVVVGGVAAGLSTLLQPQTTGLIVLRPGTTWVVAAGAADAIGYVVTATTADLLHIINSAGGTGVDYELIVVGSAT
jgi:hypothetical protein